MMMMMLKLFVLSSWVLIKENHAFSLRDPRLLLSWWGSPALKQQRLVHVARGPIAKLRPGAHQNLEMVSNEEDANDLSDNGSPLPHIIPTKGVPIHLYTNDIQPDALEQLKVLAESPVPTDYVSAMPDAHMGMGVTIGSVFASEDYVCPNAVGVDIGCGMAAIPIEGLYKGQLQPDDMNQIQQKIKEQIPTGFNQHRVTLSGTKQVLDEITAEVEPTKFLGEQLLQPKVADQMGTLGGGNHFLEVVHEEESGQVWIMLHSGSRNIGHRVATHYNKVAKRQLEKKGVDTKSLQGINYMPIESQEGQDYLRDMEWCLRYAFHNRRAMKEIMLGIVEQVSGKQADMTNSVNIHHNYCACEDCGGERKLWVTRKGATSAKLGEMGIIPGSMGTGSYITRGRGNLMSWNSASHGAGRRMSRTKAKSTIPQEAFEESMKGIVCDTDPRVRDEAPAAYKDLSVVMKNQESLTDIVHHLLPLINVKGFETKSRKQKMSLAQEKKKIMSGIKKYSEQLQNKDFLDKAPEVVVDRARIALSKLEEEAARVESSLAARSQAAD